ncbi:hypothetical protein IW152_003649, partial [Coemansia sp. BCRC 34962]
MISRQKMIVGYVVGGGCTTFDEELGDVDEGVEIDLPKAEANIDAFVERIKQISPAVRDIQVQLKDQCSPEINDHIASYLASRLFQLVGRIDYDYGYRVGAATHLWQHLDTVCSLTHIAYTNMSQDGCFLQSVRQNALTLQVLGIYSEYDYVGICGLIWNTNGSH